jgi:response regulator NasT
MRAAIAAGVSAYVVAGLQPHRVKPILEVALARFQADQKLRAELGEVKQQLAARKVIERAKGLLMSRNGCSEEEAFQLLRRQAMDKNLKLVEVAQRVIDVAELLG